MPRALLATYRVQLHRAFGFDAAAGLAPYLAALGVSHVYCSPYLQAAPGSTHGYDVVDHSRLNEELGGEDAFERMVAALAEHGLGHIADVVPNHMSVASGRLNRWWWDVLENGPSSQWASFFDVDWSAPDVRILLPVLGDHYGRELEAGRMAVEREGGSFVVHYFEHEAPVSPRTLDELLGAAAGMCANDELESLAVAFGRLPPATATDRASVEERHRDKEVLRSRLTRLLEEEPAVAAVVDREMAAVNADADRLDSLLQRQNYRLAFWRAASQELDYRRFFDIPELVALRVEDPRVFDETHAVILRLVEEGKVDGLRIDHPDGLRDPEAYLDRLARRSYGHAGRSVRSGHAGRAYVVVEKILNSGVGEQLPAAWPVDGTTGYDFLNLVSGLFVDPAGEAPLTDIYRRFTGDESDFAATAHDAKHLVMRESLAVDLDRLTALAMVACERHRRYRDYTRRELHAALREIAACFAVYRTYPGWGAEYLDRAVEEAAGRRADLDEDLFEFLRRVLLGEVPGAVESDLAARFQQFTAPVTAKGVEDTAFYRYSRLLSSNEVGGDPERFAVPVPAFHEHNARIAEQWPTTMLSTSSHDTKRSEEVRARIGLLSEIPDQWGAAVDRWAAAVARLTRPSEADGEADGAVDRAVDGATKYVLFQTLVGAWPIDPDRAVGAMLKAIKEAKVHTSWVSPDAGYEAAVEALVRGLLADREFVADLDAFVRPLVDGGRVVSLAQVLLKLTSPGVPDIYQGCELWDLSLVDPDNRRPVDFDVRQELLQKVRDAGPAEVLALMDEGAPKLWLTARTLAARRGWADDAGYQPLEACGAKAGHVVAYARGDSAVVVVPRLVISLGGDWSGTSLPLPPGEWVGVLDGGRTFRGAVDVADLLTPFPVALLRRA